MELYIKQFRRSGKTVNRMMRNGELIYQNAIPKEKEEFITYLPYLVFTGKSYIDTGIVPDINTRAELYDVSFDRMLPYHPIFGCDISDRSGTWFRVRSETQGYNFNGAVGDIRNDISIIGILNFRKIILDRDGFSIYQDDNSYWFTPLNPSYMDDMGDTTIYLNASNSTTGLHSEGDIDMTYGNFKIFKNDVLVADLRPATNGDEFFYHDLVSGEKRYNIGEGEIIYR